MTAKKFSVGSQFLWENKPYEIIRILPGKKATIEHLFKSETRTVEIAELVTALYEGNLEFVIQGRQAKTKPDGMKSTESKYLSLDECPEYLVEIAKFRFKTIEPLLKIEGRKRTRKDVEARVEEVKKKFANAPEKTLLTSVSVPSVYRWIGYWQQGGEDLRALIPETDHCGGKRKTRLDPSVLKIVDQVIDKGYFKRELVTIDDIFNEVCTTIDDKNRDLSPEEQIKAPARSTVARRIEALDIAHKFAAKNGKRAANLKFKQYGQMEYPEEPTARAEIDHTRSDLIVIDDKDNLPLGRLTVKYCYDTTTKYPLGYYMGFEPYSYYAVMECLYHAIRPKGNVRELYGTEHDWLAYGVPSTLVTDNGKDFVGNDLREACLLLGITLEHNPVRAPYLKAGVERLNRTSNTMFFHTLPGTTFSNIQERGDYDSIKQACVYLSDIDKLMHLFFLDKYAERFHCGLGGIPARRWELAVESGFEPRVPENADQLHILLSRTAQRTVWHYGIDFESIRYNNPNDADLTLLRTRLKGELTKVKYHPGNLNSIHVYDPFEKRYIEVKATSAYQEYVHDLSLWKHRVIREALLEEQRTVNPVALGRARRKIQAIVDAGRERKRASTRNREARWNTSGKPTREINQEEQKKDKSRGEQDAQLTPLPQDATPTVPAVIPEISLEEAKSKGWSIEYSKDAQNVTNEQS